ncbi:MAG: response regulator [Syntrophobacteraceae bacterium]
MKKKGFANDVTDLWANTMRKLCVLLAQDSPINQAVGRAMIEALGCRVDVASNGCEVLSSMESRSYDVFLMDCLMPLVDGFEAACLIRLREKRLGRPRSVIVAVAAGFSEQDRLHCLEAGIDDCLVKPFDLPELSKVLTKWGGRFILP